MRENMSSTRWTDLPNSILHDVFDRLNYHDRARLACTCVKLRDMSASPCLWSSLDLRTYNFDSTIASSLASRCENLQKLRFVGRETADAIIFLQARNLREISGDQCRYLPDATLSVIAARHELLECLQLGPDLCEWITSNAVKQIAFCCPKLTKLQLSGIEHVRGGAISAFGKHCQHLTDVGFLDCERVDELALGNVASLRFLSVAGTTDVDWGVVSRVWHKLPNLVGLDVSRTNVAPAVVSSLLISSQSLKVLCALNCPDLEGDANFAVPKIEGKSLLAHFTDIFGGIASLFAHTTSKGKTIFWDWRNSKKTHKSMDEMMTWLEGILSHSLLQTAKFRAEGIDDFWVNQGASMIFTLMQSSQEYVQERAAAGLGYLVDPHYHVPNPERAEAVMRDGGIRILLNLAKSCQEMIQLEAATAIAHLFENVNVAKSVVEEGGIGIIASLARSMNKWVARKAASGLCGLSCFKEHKGAIADAAGVKVLLDLISKWPSDCHILQHAAGALANLVGDDKCNTKIAQAGGMHAIIMLAYNCEFEGVQLEVARALEKYSRYNAAIGQEGSALGALVQLMRSPHEAVRLETLGSLWNLSFKERNREVIASAGGVEALVALTRTILNGSIHLQLGAARALWGLSGSEDCSVSIGLQGGIAPLISLARSDISTLHGVAAGAICNVAFISGNALHIREEGGVPVLVDICSSSTSKTARFLAALALAVIFDGSVGEHLSLDESRSNALTQIEAYIQAITAPAALPEVKKRACVQVSGNFLCSEVKIRRFISMLNYERNPSELRAFAAFALLQFTLPSGHHILHHKQLMQNAGAANVLRAIDADATAPVNVKTFARFVLLNLKHHQGESSKGI